MKIAVIGTVASSLLGFRAPLIKKITDSGSIVYALAMDFSSESEERIRDLGAIPVSYSISRYGLNPLSDIYNTIKLKRILSSLNVDIVFCYFAKPVIFGTIAAKLAGVSRRVGMLEGLGYTFTQQPQGERLKQKIIKNIQVLLYKLSLPHLDNLIVLNPDDKKDLVNRYSISVKEVSVLGGIGLDLSQYSYVEYENNEEINFIFIGRLIEEKGAEFFLSAAEIVKSKYLNVTFTVLGDIEVEGSNSISLEKLNRLCRANVVEYPGQVSNVQNWIAKSSVFVLPSYREGVPRSTQEAMSIGRAVITTDVPGCRETVEHNRNGLLIAPYSVDAIVNAMIYFIENPEQIVVMGLESHKIAVEKFNADKVNKRLYKLITGLEVSERKVINTLKIIDADEVKN